MKSTKFNVLIAVVVFSVLKVAVSDQRQKMIDFHKECMVAHEVLEEDLIEALDGNPRTDDDFYYHIFCAAKKANLMNEDGVVNTDNFENDMKDVIDEHNIANVARIVRKCLIQKDAILETIKAAVDCFLKEEHKL